MKTYMITSNDGRFITQFHNIGIARKFIHGTNYCITFNQDAIKAEGLTPHSDAPADKDDIITKPDTNADRVWYAEYSMRRAEGCNHNTACKRADEAVEAMS